MLEEKGDPPRTKRVSIAKVLFERINQEGQCAADQKVGDEILFDYGSHEIQGKICLHALYTVLPKIYVLAHWGDVA